MRIVIVGAGETGAEVASRLSQKGGNEVYVIDPDEARCEALSERLDALMLCGDGSHPEMLKKARIEEADALVATTKYDAINTVVAMLGKRFGVKKIVVKLNDTGLRPACHELGVTRVIAPKIAAAAEIMATLHGFERLDFSLAVLGGVRLVELEAKGAAGKELSEVSFPNGALAAVVLRGERAIVPRGGTRLEEEDVLLVLAEDTAALEAARRALGGEPPAA
ncbi:MAG: NAD-binding protein [Candidatus Methylomirabilis sp.]|nr:NAD-binding protein [Deltaproteobacteria bacterium]